MKRTRKCSKTRRQRAGVRGNLSPNEKKTLRAVLLYERSPNKNRILPGNETPLGTHIERLLQKQVPLTESVVVWRGQKNAKINPDLGWFSTSFRDDIARTYGGKHLFKIHIQPGVRILDMYKYYNERGIQNPVKEANELQAEYFQHNEKYQNNNYSEFQEVLVEEGGSFWQDSEKKEKGFKWIGKQNPVNPGTLQENNYGEKYKMNVFETYYFPPEHA